MTQAIARRRLLTAVAAACVLSSLPLHAQALPKRIGFLWNGKEADPVLVERVAAFKTAMRDLGYIDGRDYVIEQRFANNELSRLPGLAAQLVATRVDVFVTGGNQTIRAARAAARDIPILTTVGDHLVSAGFVANLSRPGGNITGLTSISNELYPKRLELLLQIVPTARRIGVLYDASGQGQAAVRALEPVAGKRSLQLVPATVGNATEVDAALRNLQRAQVQGVIVSQASTTIALKESITRAIAAYRLPAVYPLSVFVDAGGLLSYSTNILELYRRLPVYVDKIFKGARAGDLPVEQPAKFELIVNMTTAKALGVTIPQSVLLQAGRVIE